MTVAGGLTRLYDWPEDPTNLVGPLSTWRFHPAFSITADGLRLDCTLPSTTVPSATQPVTLDPSWYVLRSEAKAQGNVTGSARVMLRIGGAIGPSTDEISGTTDWKTIERKFIRVASRLPCQIRVEAYRSPNGVFEFRDVTLRRLIDPPVQAFVRYPNYRGLLWDDCPQTAVVWTSVQAGKLGILEVTGPAGPVYSVPVSPGERVHSIDTSDWPWGRYLLTVSVAPGSGGDFAYPPIEIVKIPASERQVPYVDAEGNLVTVHGKQFVLGVYDTGHYSALDASYNLALNRVQDTHARVRLDYLLQQINGLAYQSLLRASNLRGMSHLQVWNRVFRYNSNYAGLSTGGRMATSFATEELFWAAKGAEFGVANPGFLGFYLADELPADRSDDIFRLYRTMIAAQPSGVCFAANNSTIGAVLFRDAVDCLDIHTYPIYKEPEGTLAPLENSYAAVKGAVDAVQGSRPVWAVLQECDLTVTGHYPTLEEMRFLAWSAVIAGAQGLLWWSVGTLGGGIGGALLGDRAMLLARLTAVNEEILSYEQALLAPRVHATSSSGSVACSASVVGDIASLWAVNLTPVPQMSVILSAEGFARVVDLAPYGVELVTFPVDPVFRAASKAADKLMSEGIIVAADEDETTRLIADSFAGFVKGGVN